MAQESLWKQRIFAGLGTLAAAAVFYFLVTAIWHSTPPPPPNCTRASVFCVGLVIKVGGLEDNGLQQQTWDGIRRSKVTDVVEYVETQSSKDYLKNISYFAEAGYDVVVTVGSEAAEATIEAAEKFPETYFIGIDQYQEETRDNLAGLVFPEDQAGFLAGSLAAQMTKTGQIGAVCSTDAIPAYWRYCEGFKAGAAYVDSEVQVTVTYNGTSIERALNDPSWATETTRRIIGDGADVVFADPTATGLAALQYAARNRVYVIGSGIDQYFALPELHPSLLTSIIPLVTPGILDLIRSASRAQAGGVIFPAGNYTGEVGYTPFYDLEEVIPPEVQSRLVEIRLALTRGSLRTGVLVEKP